MCLFTSSLGFWTFVTFSYFIVYSKWWFLNIHKGHIFFWDCILKKQNTLKHIIFHGFSPFFKYQSRKKCFQCNTSKWNIGQISPKIWIFQIPDIQSRLFVTKVMYLNINSLFWNIYDVFERKSRIWTYIWLSASSPYQHPWATVYPCLAIL